MINLGGLTAQPTVTKEPRVGPSNLAMTTVLVGAAVKADNWRKAIHRLSNQACEDAKMSEGPSSRDKMDLTM